MSQSLDAHVLTGSRFSIGTFSSMVSTPSLKSRSASWGEHVTMVTMSGQYVTMVTMSGQYVTMVTMSGQYVTMVTMSGQYVSLIIAQYSRHQVP